MKKAIIIIVIVLAALGAGAYLFMQDLKHTDSQGQPVANMAGEEIADQGRGHINPGTAHDPYNSNPPTSGPHYPEPAQWGIYDKPLVDETLIHNLEHGGIWISYKDIDPDTKAKLEEIASRNPKSVIMTPRDGNDHKIVLASWRRLLKLDSFDREQIEDFIKRNKNQSPEPLAQ